RMAQAGLIDVDGLPAQAVATLGCDVAQDARAAAAEPAVHADASVRQAHEARLLQVSALGQAGDVQPIGILTVDLNLPQPRFGPAQAVGRLGDADAALRLAYAVSGIVEAIAAIVEAQNPAAHRGAHAGAVSGRIAFEQQAELLERRRNQRHLGALANRGGVEKQEPRLLERASAK